VLPLMATVLTGVAGSAVGLALGWTDAWPGRLAGRLLDLGLVVPPFLVILVVLHGWEASSLALVGAVAVSGVPFVARLARVSAARERTSGHAELARAAGESAVGVLWREVLPSVLVTVAADASLRYVGAIYLLATIGFLGFDSGDSWAAMVGANVDGARLNVWALAAPAVGIAALTVSVGVLADRGARRVAR
jgi:peptide/nickel transport system permease protein